MHGFFRPIRDRSGAPSLVAGLWLLVLLSLPAAGSVGAQSEREPVGTPAGPRPGSAAAQAGDSLAAAALAPGAEDRVPLLPAWAAESILSLERRLVADVAADDVGSIAAAVVVGDSVLWAAAFGRADRDAGTLASPGTIYRAGSISKPITALVLLALVDRGVVTLDDPVERYLPELERLANRAPEHAPIRFRDLAAHTAGLAREPAASHAARGPIREWRRKVVDAVPLTAMVAAPGEAYHYSNIGYALLGLALERAAGQPFEDLVQELVFDPFGMTSSYLVVPPPERRRLAVGYVNPSSDSIDPRVPRAEHGGRGYKVPNGGVYSTVGDLARLAMAMTGALGDAILPAVARAEALTNQTERSDAMVRQSDAGTGRAIRSGTGYGIGFQLQRVGDTLIAGHSGAVAGYTAYLAFEPETRVAVILLRNYNRGITNLGATAASTILDLVERSPPPATTPTP
jgi:CubicO group peptidase (beta-lactamase class C family)